MAKIIRNRTIRPSSRKADSKYRINLEKANTNDDVEINIDHESESWRLVYTFNMSDLQGKKNIYFLYDHNKEKPSIEWLGNFIPKIER